MLISYILKHAVPGCGTDLTPDVRYRCGIVSGITGIICNALLIIVKIILAISSGSIAIAAEAVNNLSDAGSGIITIAGFRLANRPPDAQHPFGHGRTEHVAGLIVAVLVMVLGLSFLKDSIGSLFRKSEMRADLITIVLLSSTILVKCWMFFFYRKAANMIQSSVLRAAAYDSLSDCLGTLVVVGSLIASRYTSFPVDGCAGIVVALMTLWAGGCVLRETVNKLLGEPPDMELVEKIKGTLLSCPGIDGVHDIIVHNYGENSYFVTAHAEIPSEGDRASAHDILEHAEVVVAKELSVHLQLHGDPHDKAHPEVIYWRSRLESAVSMMDSEMKVYDFSLTKAENGDVQGLKFHLLIPHRYAETESCIHDALAEKMRSYKENIGLEIRFVRSYI
ncbi:MAG: cation transporter [Lentisphaeria bacterium]|nr:cation transporter [Lentisphaeria bacterium]